MITGLWTGEPFSYDGEYYTVEEAVMRPTPVQQPRIPIVIGGWWPFKKPFQRGARWDGIIPDEPAHETEVREMLAYYHEVADDPGEVVLLATSPTLPPAFTETCRELGATWVVHSRLDGSLTAEENLERIREGPPK